MHAAAGLAEPVHREAARLLRASEGLAGAALALLEASSKPAEQFASSLGPGQESKLPKAPRTPSKGKSEGRPGGKTGVDAVRPGSTTGGGGGLGTKTKPRRRREKKNKRKGDNKGKDGKLHTDAGGEGEKAATPVASALGSEEELDDRWADQAHEPGASSSLAAPVAKRRAMANEGTAAATNLGATATTLELGYKDTILKLGDAVTVVSSDPRDIRLTSEKATLFDFNGKVWGVKMKTGPMAGTEYNFPSLLLQGQETVP